MSILAIRNEVKKIFISVLAALILFVMFDLLFGIFMKELVYLGESKHDRGYLKISKAIKGDYKYLMIGDSRSFYNVNPEIVDPSGRSFNGGLEGSGINFWLKFLEIKNDYNLKKIDKFIMEIPPTIFLESNLDKSLMTKYLLSLDKRKHLNTDLNWAESVFSNFNSFKYRDLLFSVLSGVLKRKRGVGNGYYPLEDESICKIGPKCKDFTGVDVRLNINKIKNFDSLEKINNLFKDDKNQVVFVASPFYHDQNPAIKIDIDIIGVALKKLSEMGYKVIDYRLDKRFLNRDDFFKDAVHLNKKGAEAFSSILSKDIE